MIPHTTHYYGCECSENQHELEKKQLIGYLEKIEAILDARLERGKKLDVGHKDLRASQKEHS